MGKRQPSSLRGCNCSIPTDDFDRIARKWRQRLSSKFVNKKDYDTALVNEGYRYCEANPSELAAYLEQLRPSKTERHSKAISNRMPGLFRKPKPKPRRLGPKISEQFYALLLQRHADLGEVNLVLSAYALIGFEQRNGSASPIRVNGPYLNGDPIP